MIYKQLKGAVKQHHLKKRMKVIKTGCTDNCKFGPVIARMPENEWHVGVTEESATVVFHNVISGLKP